MGGGILNINVSDTDLSTKSMKKPNLLKEIEDTYTSRYVQNAPNTLLTARNHWLGTF